MKKKTKTIGFFEKTFDVSPFAILFSLHKKGDNQFPSVNFSSDFAQFEWKTDDECISFPLNNYLIDRYFGAKHSFINGMVMVNLTLPFMIEKTETEIIFSKHRPELWDLQGMYGGGPYGEYFNDLKAKFSKRCMRQYPSLIDMHQSKKIRFSSVICKFSNDTEKSDIPHIKSMLNKLFDDDVFVEFFDDIVLPYILYLQLSEFTKQVSMINKHKKEIKHVLETQYVV
jgi:hypothetical protein